MVQYKEGENVITNSKLLPRAQLKLCRRAFTDRKLNQVWCWWGMLLVNWLITEQEGLAVQVLAEKSALHFLSIPHGKQTLGQTPRLKISLSAIWKLCGLSLIVMEELTAAHTPQCSSSKHTISLRVFVAIEAVMRLYSESENECLPLRN